MTVVGAGVGEVTGPTARGEVTTVVLETPLTVGEVVTVHTEATFREGPYRSLLYRSHRSEALRRGGWSPHPNLVPP